MLEVADSLVLDGLFVQPTPLTLSAARGAGVSAGVPISRYETCQAFIQFVRSCAALHTCVGSDHVYLTTESSELNVSSSHVLSLVAYCAPYSQCE
jgi:hypothetical protein